LKKTLSLLILAIALSMSALAQTATITATAVTDGNGGVLQSGSWCFGSSCLTIVSGAISGSATVPQGTQNITIINNGLSVLTVNNVTISGSTFSWDAFSLGATQSAYGPTDPTMTAAVGAAYLNTYTNQKWSYMTTIGWVTVSSQKVLPSGQNGGSGVPTLLCTAPCTWVRSDASPASLALYALIATPGTVSSNWVLQSGGSAVIKYLSQLGCTAVSVVFGASASGAVDCAPAVQAAVLGGNVKLIADIGVALASSILLDSTTEIAGLGPTTGFIMMTASNVEAVLNRHQNAATTASGTGFGFLPSNIVDHDIYIHDVMVNCNSTQAVTGTDPLTGVAHKANLSGKWVGCMRFVGADRTTLDHDYVYDGGTFEVTFANNTNTRVTYSQIITPFISVSGKNTDCIHNFGPATNAYYSFNTLACGDDSIALNADDGHEVRFGSAYAGLFNWPGVNQGPILHVWEDGNFYAGSAAGWRNLSVTERIDDIHILHTSGTVTGIGCSNARFFTAFGAGNFGDIIVDDFNVQLATPLEPYYYQGTFCLVDGNINSLKFKNVIYRDPPIGFNFLTYLAGSTAQTLSVNDSIFIVSSTAQPFSLAVQLNSPVINPIFSGNEIQNSLANNTYMVGGSSVPAKILASGFMGPLQNVLSPTFSPALKYGDAFTNAAAANTNYIATLFNEAGSGALVGTTPSTTNAGAAWVLTSGTSPTYVGGGGATTSVTGGAIISSGQANYTLRLVPSALGLNGGAAGAQLLIRYTDANNNVAINFGPSSTVIFNTVAGVFTQICATSAVAAIGQQIAIAVNGSLLTYNDGSLGPGLKCTIPSVNLTAPNVGFAHFAGSNPLSLSSLSVTSY
jgi:hypothetical protein